MWAVLTRLEEPKKAQITLLQKLKLYGGKTLPGFTEDNVKELREESPREGMEGIARATSRTRSRTRSCATTARHLREPASWS